MNNIKNSLLAALGSIVLLACNKTIQKDYVNPNQPTTVDPSLILGTVLTDMSGTVTNTSSTGLGSGSQIGNLGGVASFDLAHRWSQYYCINYNYYGTNTYSWQSGPFDGYTVLKNVVQMESEAATRKLPAVNPYAAIGKLIRAWYYYNMTMMMGDIPQASALQPTASPTPAYTPQKQVFQYVLNILDTANTQLAALIAAHDITITGSSQDIYYGGDLTKWQKAVNSFKLRVLINLSKKAADPDLQVAQQFAKIFNTPGTYPVFTGQADDLAFVYQPTYNLYYFSPATYGSIGSRYNLAATYTQAVAGLNDPRVFVTGEPAWKLVDSLGYAPTDFRAFRGSATGENIITMQGEASAGLYSFINRKKYFSTFVGEPDVLVGYKEMCFNIAEAANLGWITANPETWYKTGITESFKFYGLDPTQTSFTAYFQTPTQGSATEYTGFPFTFDFNAYYNQASVKYAGGAAGINQIALQKYIVMFANSAWEAYYSYRRTGIPALTGGTGVGNSGLIPQRWAYPISEQTINSTNWKAALASQGFASDDLNQRIWLLK